MSLPGVTVVERVTLLSVLTLHDTAADRVTVALRLLAGSLAPGARLPSVRELAASHRASPVTVSRAVARLAAEGVVEPRPGRGTFVARREAPAAGDLRWQEVALGGRAIDSGGLEELMALPAPGVVALSTGYIDAALQPARELGAALARAARRPDAWDRLPVAGLPALREWFASQAGGLLRGHDVVVSPGGQSALGTAFRALAAPGDTVLVESPTYGGAVAAARAAGLRVVPVPADGDGIRTDLLADAFVRTRARVLYLQPLFANPHGATLAAERREPLMAAVAAAGAFVIEDDYARDLAIDADPPPPLVADDPDGHVVYLRSLTKVAAPGLRIAAIGARGAAGARLAAARIVDDFFVAGPMQHAALDLVGSPAWRRHLRRLRTALRERRDALLTALGEQLPQAEPVAVPRGGLHLWVALPDGTDDRALADRARQEGVIVSPGAAWYAAEAPRPHLRLTFAGAPPAELSEGVRRLAAAYRAG
jgi:DNA-binding transcriptional MocR family regulator